jgi:L-malate glycosyltransferase
LKKLVHIIDSLKRGGAEILLHQVVTNLTGYDNYIIILTDENDFSVEEMQGIPVFSLKFNSILSLPLVVLRLQKLIKKLKPDIVHAHLPLSSLLSRLSVPSKIKLIISVHNKFSESFKNVSPTLFYLEKKLHSEREILLFVSAVIREDYNQIVGIKGQSYVLYNFIADKYFADENRFKGREHTKTLRLVSVGSLKSQKNFDTLIKVFSLLDATMFSLDIIGEGGERKMLEHLINEYQLKNVKLKGAVTDIENHLINYDGYILASRYEGFGIAPLEAAAVGLPLLLSDIDVFKEVTYGYATYFSPKDIKDLAAKLSNFSANYEMAHSKATLFKHIVKEKFSRVNYMKQLNTIYSS